MSAAPPSPVRIFETLTAFQETAALRTAIELDLFTRIGSGRKDPGTLAGETGASERGLRILCDYLSTFEFLVKDGSGYSLTPDSAAFLDRASPVSIADAAIFLTAPKFTEAFSSLGSAVLRGGTALGDEGTLGPEDPVWVDFARGMAGFARLSAGLVAAAAGPVTGKVLDVAAGHGEFGIAIAEANPTATAVALDWKNVLEVARDRARGAGLGSRFETIEGSAFDVDWGNGYEVVLIPNFLHHFDEDGCVGILERARKALAPGGRTVVVEFVPDEDRLAPPPAGRFALVMLATTPRGDAYTLAEYDSFARRAGFSDVELRELPPSPQRALILTV